MPTATHGGIGHTLSLNALSPPFKVVLTLPNLCVVPRDSRDAKTDMHWRASSPSSRSQPPAPPRWRASRSPTNSSPRASPSIRPSIHLSIQTLKTSKIDLFLLSGICSQALSPQAFQTLTMATCSPAVNACFGGFLCSHIISRYIAFCLCQFPLTNQFLQHFVFGCLGPLAPGR